MTRRPGVTVSAFALASTAVLGPGLTGSTATTFEDVGHLRASRPAVVEHVVIGRSVQGRPLHAFRLGDPAAPVTAVAMATLHGDERAPREILQALRDGPEIDGVDLWVLPTVNPDGYAADRRQNARGVDLNRNFPRSWRELDGAVESGRAPASEPETRAIMRFLEQVRPRFVVSFHQPLGGVDSYQAKRPAFVRRLADQLRLPVRSFSCGGGCHGTFTQWFNQRLGGAAVTVELGPRPTLRRLRVTAPRQLVRALGGRR